MTENEKMMLIAGLVLLFTLFGILGLFFGMTKRLGLGVLFVFLMFSAIASVYIVAIKVKPEK